MEQEKQQITYFHEDTGLQYYMIDLEDSRTKEHYQVRLFEYSKMKKLSFETQEEWKIRKMYIKEARAQKKRNAANRSFKNRLTMKASIIRDQKNSGNLAASYPDVTGKID